MKMENMAETLAAGRTTCGPRRKRRLLFFDIDEATGKPCIMSIQPDGMGDDEYLAEVHRMADTLEDESVCYFVGGETGPVKIGHAKCVKKRLVGLQNGSPVILKVLATATGGLTRETAYHYQFAHHRMHGEWFERCPEIEAEIERLSTSPAKERKG